MELESEETEEAMDQDSEEKRDTFPTFRFKNWHALDFQFSTPGLLMESLRGSTMFLHGILMSRRYQIRPRTIYDCIGHPQWTLNIKDIWNIVQCTPIKLSCNAAQQDFHSLCWHSIEQLLRSNMPSTEIQWNFDPLLFLIKGEKARE